MGYQLLTSDMKLFNSTKTYPSHPFSDCERILSIRTDKMKLKLVFPALLIFLSVFVAADSFSPPFLRLFGFEDYYQQRRPRNYGRQYGSEGGNRRYKAICRVHAVDAQAFPGRVGNPVCPY
ncbi:hypothetical protein TcasGA2_TC012038 [Tribolium castaneum]|uniref:Uncharacterized protein n=1 Tax=Tribolium castaneum TaxID=7070 RepID=D6X2A4_TRICA|nr:hypothetical protein TcasGA2_TC012038 [Tribolium castaneum]